MARENILVVEDEEDIQALVRFHLAREGYQVRGVVTGEDALAAIKERPWDLVLLDLMLPDIDGLSVARCLRSSGEYSSIPIIIVSAKTEESDVVAGLEIGAVDYVTKPFSPRILIARVRNALRQKAAAAEQIDKSVIRCHDLVIDVRKHTVTVGGHPADLTHAEFELLAFLAARPGWAFTRSQIVDAVRGFNHAVTDRSVDVQIVGLRRKLGPWRGCIQTVRGVGYRFQDNCTAEK